MNKTFALLMSLLIFYGFGGGGLIYIIFDITNNILVGILGYLIYVLSSFFFLLEVSGT